MIRKIVRKSRKIIANHRAIPHPNPIFLLGNEKSGTTVIAASLAEAVGKSVTLDIPGTWDPVQSKLKNKELDIKTVIDKNRVDFSREIIKEPVLTFEYDALADYYEAAKFVLIVRDPRDNIRSILNRLKLPGNLKELGEEQITSLGPLWTTWNTVIYNDWLGAEYENYIASMAERWNYAVDVFLNNPSKVTLFRYEDFLKNKVAAIQQLAGKLALPVKHDIGEKVNTQFQPKGNRTVDLGTFFGEKNLAIINRLCKSRMKTLGYAAE